MKNFLQLRLGDHRPFGRIAVKEEAEQGLVDPGLLRECALRRFLRGHGFEDQRNIVAERIPAFPGVYNLRSEEHTSELQSLMRISYAVFCLTKKKTHILLTFII